MLYLDDSSVPHSHSMYVCSYLLSLISVSMVTYHVLSPWLPSPPFSISTITCIHLHGYLYATLHTQSPWLPIYHYSSPWLPTSILLPTESYPKDTNCSDIDTRRLFTITTHTKECGTIQKNNKMCLCLFCINCVYNKMILNAKRAYIYL